MIPMPEFEESDLARFHARVRTSDGCWLWAGEITSAGYGQFSLYRRSLTGGRDRLRLLAHRVAYALAHEEDPGNAVVRHRCDNPPCCNPAHLETGTQAQNIADALARGRLDFSGLTAYREARDQKVADLFARGLKRCRLCKEVVSVQRFSRNRTTYDGLQHDCKPCALAVNRAYLASRIGTVRKGAA